MILDNLIKKHGKRKEKKGIVMKDNILILDNEDGMLLMYWKLMLKNLGEIMREKVIGMELDDFLHFFGLINEFINEISRQVILVKERIKGMNRDVIDESIDKLIEILVRLRWLGKQNLRGLKNE